MPKLTARQQEILDLIKSNLDETGYPPTRAEIAQNLGFRSANAAEDHLKALARKGVIEMIPGASRGIRVVENLCGIPVVGSVAAGEPILSEQHIENYLEIPQGMFHTNIDFLVNVRGDSMRDAGILDGDLLAIHRQSDAENKQIVVARVDGEVTVKRLVKNSNKSQVQLAPENELFEPILIDLHKQDLRIEGIAVGVIRRAI
ncbi:MAG: LexA repressor [Porticoccaceae bacterium]|nr:LexA repressor [Porticoccaceae bacterium]|tara:strand:+ start:492 stop:1097 length:606 start_codon:yes stop_codon:yes gene_type:complete